MSAPLQAAGLPFPELVVGIASPIGVELSWVVDGLFDALRSVGYTSNLIRLTDEMLKFPVVIEPEEKKDFQSVVNYKMRYATALCEQYKNASTISAVGVVAIQRKRKEITRNDGSVPQRQAYVLRQLKRPEEVNLLRRVYGKQFVLVSAHGSYTQRLNFIMEQLKRDLSTEASPNELEKRAKDLIDRDAEEDQVTYGQNLRDTFHMADVFVDGGEKTNAQTKIQRFVQAFFGRVDIAPSKDEYGMYAAKSASLRSTDLSRQVGAAIFSKDGELITQGCNEVPKAFGGTYWDLEVPDFRDVKMGYDPNERLKQELLRDLFSRLLNGGYLSDKAKSLGSVSEIVAGATRKAKEGTENNESGPLVGARIMDLTEYGRVVHAEMCAICDAARTGKILKDSVLFCTTFPCHNCTKHILAAGISKVIYMEPYSKSRAKDLHWNEVEIDSEIEGRVSFVPFLGISPARYRDIFQKARRKDSDGYAKQWYEDGPKPMLDIAHPAYIMLEDRVAISLVVDVGPSDSSTPDGAASIPSILATPDEPAPPP